MTNALPACAGFFMRSHCPHPRLFEEEYKRSNRNRGTKILRCFPHCCPHHVDRSYCGSSLEVVLRFDLESHMQDLEASFDVTNVFVFARFETVDSKNLSGTYALSYLRSVSQSEMNPEASWIEGVRQTATDRQQHSQQLHGRQPASRSLISTETTQSATFVLNGQAFAKWYYHWESGANKVQRATKHALKAYVFYPTQEGDSVQYISSQQHRQQELSTTVQQEATTDGMLELLCVVTSPPFTVVSYRRAPLEASFAGGADALEQYASASLMPHYETDTAHPVDSRLRRLVQSQISRAFQEYNMNQHQQRQQDPRGRSSSRDEEDEEQQGDDDRGPFDRYRQLQEREGLRFRLLTPEDAVLSGSSLHGHIQRREPRLVFDSTRRTDDRQHWRDVNKEGGEVVRVDGNDENDTCDEASWGPQGTPGYDVKASKPVGVPLSTTDPVTRAEMTANVALLRFQQQQLQFDTHQRELQQLTDLAIVHFFVSHITTNTRRFASLEVVFTIAISEHWKYASGEATHLARLLLSIAKNEIGEKNQGATTTRSNTGGSLTDAKLEELTLVLAEVCLWALSPKTIELVQTLLAACHPLLLASLKSIGSSKIEDDGKELRAAFLDCAGQCCGALNEFLQTPRATQTTIHNVRELSDAILGVVFSDPELEKMRFGLRAMLQRPTIVLEDSKENISADAFIPRCNLVGWHGFLAQVREGYLRDQYSGRDLPWSPMHDTNARSSRWTADWLLQPGNLAVTHRVGSQSHASEGTQTLTAQEIPSMWISCLALSQLLHLKLAVAGDPLHTLYVQAEPSVLSPDNAWLRLICDGRVRVAPVAPNGLTSLMGGASFGGDYVAYQQTLTRLTGESVDRNERMTQTTGIVSDHSSICVEFYWWSLGQTQGESQNRLVAFRSVVILKTVASGAFMEGQMDLERGFVDHQVIAAAEYPDLELWTPTERVQAVASWDPWLSIQGVYARGSSSAKSD